MAKTPSARIPLRPLERVGGPDAWWQRKEMLIALLHPRCDLCRRFERALQEALAEEPDREVGTALLPVREAGGGHGLSPGPEAARLAGELQSALGLDPASAYVVVADRFAEVTKVRQVHDGPEDAAREALHSVDAIELQCPE